MTVTTIDDPSDLSGLHADAPNGVRANMIFSAYGAAAFRGRAGTDRLAPPTKTCCATCVRSPTSCWSVQARRGPSDTARPASLKPSKRCAEQIAGSRRHRSRSSAERGRLPPTLFVDASSTPILVTSASAVRAPLFGQRPALETSGGGRGDGRCRRGDKAAACPRHATDPVRVALLFSINSSTRMSSTKSASPTAPRLAGSQPVGARTPSRQSVPASLELRHAPAV